MKFWLSWYHDQVKNGPFTLHTPWWETGYDMGERITMCAAIAADSEDLAKRRIHESYDVPPASIEWRFVLRRPDCWEGPNSERFPTEAWMDWSAIRDTLPPMSSY